MDQGKARWTPRARKLAVLVFLGLALAALVTGIMGAVCEQPSFDCLRDEGRNAVRIAVLSVPLITYAAYRLTRGNRGRHDGHN
ncbi:MAG: hypothetical protein ACRDKG_14395 [Actinomycetota bacterium]